MDIFVDMEAKKNHLAFYKEKFDTLLCQGHSDLRVQSDMFMSVGSL